MTSSEPKEVPDSAPPATEDIHVDQSSEVTLEEEMELQLESDGDQNNAEFTVDLNNSWEAEEPMERNAGVGRRVLPSRSDIPSEEPVLPWYVILYDK